MKKLAYNLNPSGASPILFPTSEENPAECQLGENGNSRTKENKRNIIAKSQGSRLQSQITNCRQKAGGRGTLSLLTSNSKWRPSSSTGN